MEGGRSFEKNGTPRRSQIKEAWSLDTLTIPVVDLTLINQFCITHCYDLKSMRNKVRVFEFGLSKKEKC